MNAFAGALTRGSGTARRVRTRASDRWAALMVPRGKWDAVRPAIALFVITMSFCVLLGWLFGIAWLKSILPHLTTMKVNTALGLGAAAAAVGLLESGRPGPRTAAIAAALLTTALGVLTLVEYWAGVQLGIDQLLFADPASTSMPFNGRMSPATAISFVACGSGLVLHAVGRSSRAVQLAHLLAIVPAAVGFLSLAGYAYNVERLYRFGPYVSVALHTGICLSLLAAALLLIRSDEGWGFWFVERPIARAAFSRIMVLSILVPFTAGLLVVWGIRAGFYQPLYAPTLFAVAAAGALIWLAFRSARILGAAEGDLLAARAIAQHRSDQLEASRSRHLALVEELPQLVWTCLPDGHCDYLSRQWVAYTGRPEAEQLGFNWLNAIHPDDVANTERQWLGAVAGKHPYDIEFRIRAADASYRWFKSRATPIQSADGRIAYWFGTCTDIEENVHAREVLAQARSDLEAAITARTAELMAVEAQLRQSQKMEAVGQLTGGLAHDFNNLLAGIMGSLELLAKRLAEGRYETLGRYIATAEGAAQRAAALTQRLLAFSRQQTLDPRPTDVNQLVGGMADLIRRTVGPAIHVDVDPGAALSHSLIDPAQLENTLLNLCINGRDAMPSGGRLTIATATVTLGAGTLAGELPPGRYVRLSVTDTGHGMTAEVRQRAFDPFFTTKPLGEGTGLGLSMSYGFVRQSGGDITIDSAPGSGTSMHIDLPYHEAPPDQSIATAAAPSFRPPPGQRVLVVDDETVVREVIAEVLTDFGYTVLQAADGAGGMQVARSEVPLDLLITDVGLPGGMNGRQVADAMRLLRPELKVLFVTGYAAGEAVGTLQSGAALLTKPFAIQDLVSRLRELA